MGLGPPQSFLNSFVIPVMNSSPRAGIKSNQKELNIPTMVMPLLCQWTYLSWQVDCNFQGPQLGMSAEDFSSSAAYIEQLLPLLEQASREEVSYLVPACLLYVLQSNCVVS